MTLHESLACEPPRERRFRLIAPLVLLLGLVLLAIVPGMVVERDSDSATPRALTHLAGPAAGIPVSAR